MRNAFFSPGYSFFGPAFARDYLRLAWRVSRNWGHTGPGSLDLLGYRIDYFNQSHALFLVHEIFVNAAYAFECRNSPPSRDRLRGKHRHDRALLQSVQTGRRSARVRAGSGHVCAPAAEQSAVNGLRNVQTENAAVGDRDGTIAFYSSSSDPGGLTGSIDPSWGGHARQDVRVVRLSALLRQPVDFLKLDVEGAEYEIVADLISTGAIRWVLETVIEYHELPTQMNGGVRLATALEAAGFVVTIVTADPAERNGVIRARRATAATSTE